MPSGIYKLEKIVGLDGISSLDEAKSLAMEKVQLNPVQTICEYFQSENLQQSDFSVQCTKEVPKGGKHWKNCFEDSLGDIVMDTAHYAFDITHAHVDNVLQNGYAFTKG